MEEFRRIGRPIPSNSHRESCYDLLPLDDKIDFFHRVAGLYLVLDDVAQTMPDRKLSEQQEQDLSALMEGCRDVLLELDAELTKYKVLDNKPLNPVARSRKAWKRMNWDQEKIKGFRDRITSNITLLTAYNTSLTRYKSSARSLVTEALLTVSTSKVSETIRGEVAVLDKRLEGLQQSQTRQEYQSIIDWLSPLNFSSTQIDILRRRQEGTGQWLLESQEFKDWLRGEKETLWCPGIREFQDLVYYFRKVVD